MKLTSEIIIRKNRETDSLFYTDEKDPKYWDTEKEYKQAREALETKIKEAIESVLSTGDQDDFIEVLFYISFKIENSLSVSVFSGVCDIFADDYFGFSFQNRDDEEQDVEAFHKVLSSLQSDGYQITHKAMNMEVA